MSLENSLWGEVRSFLGELNTSQEQPLDLARRLMFLHHQVGALPEGSDALQAYLTTGLLKQILMAGEEGPLKLKGLFLLLARPAPSGLFWGPLPPGPDLNLFGPPLDFYQHNFNLYEAGRAASYALEQGVMWSLFLRFKAENGTPGGFTEGGLTLAKGVLQADDGQKVTADWRMALFAEEMAERRVADLPEIQQWAVQSLHEAPGGTEHPNFLRMRHAIGGFPQQVESSYGYGVGLYTRMEDFWVRRTLGVESWKYRHPHPSLGPVFLQHFNHHLGHLLRQLGPDFKGARSLLVRHALQVFLDKDPAAHGPLLPLLPPQDDPS
jgi:hypothetical protein